MFSLHALVELVKGVAKVALVGSVAVLLLWSLRMQLFAIGAEAPGPAIAHALHLVGLSALVLSASTLLIAAVDVPFQLFDHARKLRMTTQQVRGDLIALIREIPRLLLLVGPARAMIVLPLPPRAWIAARRAVHAVNIAMSLIDAARSRQLYSACRGRWTSRSFRPCCWSRRCCAWR
jgi:hypothetical protein